MTPAATREVTMAARIARWRVASRGVLKESGVRCMTGLMEWATRSIPRPVRTTAGSAGEGAALPTILVASLHDERLDHAGLAVARDRAPDRVATGSPEVDRQGRTAAVAAW